MSPARGAAARVDDVVEPRSAPKPALRPAEPDAGRIARLTATLRSGNVLGRVGTLTAVALFLSVFGVVVFQALLVQGQARLDHVDAQIIVQQQDAKQLKAQLATLSAPGRIVSAARGYGMVDAGDVVYLEPSVHDDGAARLPATTTTTTPASASSTQGATRP